MAKLASDVEELPGALTARDQWVCWRREERDGKATKVPVDPATGGYASTTDPDTWADVKTALEAVEAADADGVGFVFTDDDPVVGVDLDDCRDSVSGTIDEWARDVVTRLDSYAEVSPSGTGVHVIAEGELPEGRSRKGDVEMYETSRFFTVTGEHLDATPRTVESRIDAIRGVHAGYVQEASVDVEAEPTAPTGDGIDLDDEELLERARAAENGDRFEALFQGRTDGYDSHSEADMALCLHLAFWTGGDPSRMDALFRQSGLFREKWDEVHYADGATYGERTIERALDRVDEVYAPDANHRGGDSDSDGSDAKFGSDSGDDSPSMSDGRVEGDDAVYLEERNRLLRETVQAQEATIGRQYTRIERLEAELERERERLAGSTRRSHPPTEHPGLLARLRVWLGGG